MTTKDELMEAARALSLQQDTLRCMGMMNADQKLEDRVEQQAAYRVQSATKTKKAKSRNNA